MYVHIPMNLDQGIRALYIHEQIYKHLPNSFKRSNRIYKYERRKLRSAENEKLQVTTVIKLKTH